MHRNNVFNEEQEYNFGETLLICQYPRLAPKAKKCETSYFNWPLNPI